MQPDAANARAPKTAPEPAIVTCRGLSKVYSDGAVKVAAVNGVDLDIAAGDFATLSGPSGSGKTTLLNLIGGLDRPTSGIVKVDGEALGNLDTAHLADLRLHKIGFVFQAYNLIPVFSALENIEFVLQLLGINARDRRDRAAAALADVGLAGIEGRRPSHLSGGQQQRVAVARALVARPAIVLADEPTANLDSKSANDLVSMMADLNARSGTTFLIGTHDSRVIARARRHIEMVDGKITADTSGGFADVTP